MHSALTCQVPWGKLNNHQVNIMNNPCRGEVKVAFLAADTAQKLHVESGVAGERFLKNAATGQKS